MDKTEQCPLGGRQTVQAGDSVLLGPSGESGARHPSTGRKRLQGRRRQTTNSAIFGPRPFRLIKAKRNRLGARDVKMQGCGRRIRYAADKARPLLAIFEVISCIEPICTHPFLSNPYCRVEISGDNCFSHQLNKNPPLHCAVFATRCSLLDWCFCCRTGET